MRAANRHRRRSLAPCVNRDEQGPKLPFYRTFRLAGSVLRHPAGSFAKTYNAGQARLMADTTGDAIPGTVTVQDAHDGDGVRRRDFINIAAVGAAGVAGVSVLLPLISQMAPSADVLAESSTEVDVSAIQPGQAIKAVFRKQPLFVRRLTPAEVQVANAVNVGSLRDPQTLQERTKEGHEDVLITMGVCTHLGCVPLGAAEGEVKGEFGGYFCPCHGSHYDTAARIRKGPAPSNLEVPEYEFTSDTVVKVG